MKKIYKIEKKPIFWHITLSYGSYSDYREEHYFIAANSPEEAKEFFKIYWKALKEGEWGYGTCLIFEDGEKFNPFNKENVSWDTDYGDAHDVSIEMLEVIHLQKLK